MTRRAALVLSLLVLASPLAALPPPALPPVADAARRTEPKAEPVKLEVGRTVTVRVGEKCVIVAATNASKVTWKAPADIDTLAIDGKRLAVWATEGTYKILASVPAGDDVLHSETILIVTGPRPPPGPGPTPVPPEPVPPAPQPVTSFHVIFVKESGAVLSPAQTSIPGAKAIRDYLAAKTTPEAGMEGWREFDPQANAVNDPSQTMKALWAAVQPKLTAIPCMVVEVNGKAEILPFPKDAAECLATLKKHSGN